jgi:hypothetical protein
MNDDIFADLFGYTPQRPAPRSADEVLPKITPEEKQSLYSQFLGYPMSGLQYVAGTLNKPGRMIRSGILGGNAREFFGNIVPFSDTLGITDPRQEKTGRDLLQEWGFLDKGEKTWGGFGAGLALDIGTDPLVALGLGGGALNQAGRAAAKIGARPTSALQRVKGFESADEIAKAMGFTDKTAQLSNAAAGRSLAQGPLPSAVNLARAEAQAVGTNLDDLIGKSLGGGIGRFSVPFTGGRVGFDIGGQTAAKAMDWLGDAALYSAPGRYASRLFDPAVRGTSTEAVQRLARESAPELDRANYIGRSLVGEEITNLKKAGALDNIDDFRQMVEGFSPSVGPPRPEMVAAANRLKDYNQELLRVTQDLGGNIGSLDDFTLRYAPRYRTYAPTQTAKNITQADKVDRALATGFGSFRRRKDWTREIPGGTDTINRMSLDELIAGPNRQLTQSSQVRDRILDEYLPEWTQLGGSAALRGLQQNYRGSVNTIRSAIDRARQAGNTAAVADMENLLRLRELQSQANRIQKGLYGIDPESVRTGTKLFGNHPLADQAVYQRGMNQVANSLDVILSGLAKAPRSAARGNDRISLMDAMKKLGLVTSQNRQGIAALADRMGLQGMTPAQIRATLRGSTIDRALVNDLKTMTGGRGASYMEPLKRVYDSYTDLTKASLTSPYPAFHIRNLMSAGYQMLKDGALDPSSWLKADRFVRGKEAIPGLGESLYGAHAAGRGLSPVRESVARQGNTVQQVSELIPGLDPSRGMIRPALDALYETAAGGLNLARGTGSRLLEVAKNKLGMSNPAQNQAAKDAYSKLLAESWVNPFNVSGVGGFSVPGIGGINRRNIDTFAPVKYGREVGDYVDDLTRTAMFLARKKQGYTDLAAARDVTRSLYDYSKATDFERRYMKRLFPFYSFTRNAIPETIGDLVSTPGGLTAQMLKASDRMRGGDDEFLPPYLGAGLAVPVGEMKEGTRRYLTRFDLPYEGVLGLLDTGPNALQRTLGHVLGQMAPQVKAIPEYVSGYQFHTGRELPDLWGPTGMGFMDQAIMNSPLARAETTMRTLTDPRKLSDPLALLTNLGTGVRMTDVDVDRQKMFALRDLFGNMLKKIPEASSLESYYVPLDKLRNLSPEELQLYRLYKETQKDIRQASKQREKTR